MSRTRIITLACVFFELFSFDYFPYNFVSAHKLCVADHFKSILLWWFFLFYVLVFEIFELLAPYVCFHIFS